ncbi:hypothetical protein XENOCAPTIV_004350 [Xenoophorus captivus]|uniref:Uncharacterized protein n=1 Tax=Xenoophorus captivus TaxID=1517983 RepID=A0ABV0RTD6_9TELE
MSSLQQFEMSQPNPDCAAVQQPIQCRLPWHLSGCLCFSVCFLSLLMWSLLYMARVCGENCMNLLLLDMFAPIFSPVALEGSRRTLIDCFYSAPCSSVGPQTALCGLHFLTQTEQLS